MLRKLVLALSAFALIGAAALSPTAASAHPWHHHYHGWYRGGIALYPGYYAGPDCYLVKRVFWSHHERHVRYVQVCD